MIRRRLLTPLVALTALVALSACTVTNGGQDDDVLTTWDLRDSHAITDVGWPDSAADLSAFEARTSEGLERILLPGDVEVTGDFRANASRAGGLAGRDLSDELRSLTVTFADEPIDDVLDRARAYGEPLGIDLSSIVDWAEANASGQATGAGEGLATSSTVDLDDTTTLSLSTRARPFGEGLLRLEVFFMQNRR